MVKWQSKNREVGFKVNCKIFLVKLQSIKGSKLPLHIPQNVILSSVDSLH
jgi:hypothetical protein